MHRDIILIFGILQVHSHSMKKLIALLLLVLSTGAFSQPYQADWASLDTRPVPKWFTDAKFGIFIHWGVYAVPGYTTKGNYAEWYQNGLENGNKNILAYHKAKFGNQTYYQLADQFKAELFQPDEWAKLFEASGAKYIVLTSKHHDGFTLWPSKEADRDWGFPWNAVEVGPKRDLLGDLFKAVRKTSVHAGMYYSLYEWFNPLWKKDKEAYALQHAWPQMQELINKYQPDVFWTDGDWDAPAETWHSQQFLAWLYNESPVKDRIVTYDRWGSGVRFHHGGVYTPEYQPDLDFEDHPWEESRGMGYSYGYNREEDAWDYNSTPSLVYHLVDKVSRGGNFLLDIGPDEHGKIPPIMQERLLQIGDWLKINGDAIYNTERWQQTCQWSEGKRDYKAKKGEDIMVKLTVDPEPGYAVKEVFYTYNAATNSLYAIFPKYPSDKKLVLHHMPAGIDFTDVHFLSTGEKLRCTSAGTDKIIELPEYDPNRIKAPYAYVVKIGGFGAYMPKPVIHIDYPADLSHATITLTTHQAGAEIQYQLGDGPVQTYTTPVIVKNDTRIQAYIKGQPGMLPGDTAQAEVVGLTLLKANRTGKLQPGLSYKYVESDVMNMKTLQELPAVKEGVASTVSVALKQRKDKFGLIFTGFVKVDKTGGYMFYTPSDDGSRLEIDGRLIVNNDGPHVDKGQGGRCLLEKGYHAIKLLYYDSGGDNNLHFQYHAIGEKKTEVPGSILFHK